MLEQCSLLVRQALPLLHRVDPLFDILFVLLFRLSIWLFQAFDLHVYLGLSCLKVAHSIV